MKCACSLSFFFFFRSFGWHQSSFPRAPWKTNCLCLESILQWCVRGGKYRNVHMIYVPYDFQYNCKKNKRKNDLLFSTVLYIALISRHSLCKWKKCVIFFKIHQAFITLFVLLCLLLFHRLCLWSSFWRGRGLHCIFLCLSFVSPFLFLSFIIFKIWSLVFCLCSHTKCLSNQDKLSSIYSKSVQGGGWRKWQLYLVGPRVLTPYLGLNLCLMLTYIEYIVKSVKWLTIFCWKWHE